MITLSNHFKIIFGSAARSTPSVRPYQPLQWSKNAPILMPTAAIYLFLVSIMIKGNHSPSTETGSGSFFFSFFNFLFFKFFFATFFHFWSSFSFLFFSYFYLFSFCIFLVCMFLILQQTATYGHPVFLVHYYLPSLSFFLFYFLFDLFWFLFIL